MTPRPYRSPTPRRITEVVRRERSTLLKLECGHDRSIGGNRIDQNWSVGSAHMLSGEMYPCVDGACGRYSA